MNAQGSASEVAQLRQLLELRKLVDEYVEQGLLKRLSLADVMAGLLEEVREVCDAQLVFVESYDEDLELRVFQSAASEPIARWEHIAQTTSPERREVLVERQGSTLIIAQPLDVAGEWFGRAGLIVHDPSQLASADHLRALLEMACEELDNFLFSIKAAREKHRVMMELGDALRHRVLSEGLRQAVAALSEATPLERMLLVYVAQEGAGSALHVQVFNKGEMVIDTLSGVIRRDAAEPPLGESWRDELRSLGSALLGDESRELLERFGFHRATEELLISGVTHSVRVGKVVATSASGQFNTWDRELLSGFSNFIRQRVVDFNKEWRRLAASFRTEDVAQLLQHDSYEARFLAPREETVAIAYADIAGFTRISEQILKTPSAVAELVEAWSQEAVDLVWQHGGVFDKMVGDCIIALFGPPFYDRTPGERLLAAIEWARAMREVTRAFPARAGFEPLRAEGLSVTIGVNLAPLFVGTFGPNANFTGFSSGMNNTARLQACATRDEILVMADAVAQLAEGHGLSFGDRRSAQVKNVAQPLEFYALR